MNITVYGIPTCDTCRKARKWLDERGQAHTWIDLREKPPSKSKLQRWVKALSAKALRNTSGGSYRALGPEKSEWTDAQWLAAFAADPMLIKRPVLEVDGEPAAVGFKADAWAARLG